MFKLEGLKRALQKFGEVEKPRAERLPAPGLAARYGLDPGSIPAGVKNISTSGIYLFTEKRLHTGDLITLTLEEYDQPESNLETQFSVHARVAREGEDGVGLSFILPPGLDMDLWGVLLRNIVVLKESEQITDMFRTLHTILFLCRICQAEASESIVLLGKDLHPDRTAMLVKIALTAEKLLASEPNGDRMRGHPTLVANILRDGSWAPDDVTAELWAGLLAASCSAGVPEDTNQILVDLLVNLTPTQAKIFVLACERVLAHASGLQKSAYDPVILTPKEMVALIGIHDLSRAATDLAYLFNLGLIRSVFDFSSYHQIDSFDVTPSHLGVELYRHCHGSREKLDPALVEKAKDQLEHFLPTPQRMDFLGAPPPLPPVGG